MSSKSRILSSLGGVLAGNTLTGELTVKNKLWSYVDATTTQQYHAWGDGTTTYASIGGYRDSATAGHLEFYSLVDGMLYEGARLVGNKFLIGQNYDGGSGAVLQVGGGITAGTYNGAWVFAPGTNLGLGTSLSGVINAGGNYNVGVGGLEATFYDAASANRHTAIGYNAFAGVHGFYADDEGCVAVGYSALSGQRFGYGSYQTGGHVAIGSNSMAGVFYGSRNTTVGTNSLLGDYWVGENTAIGYKALATSQADQNTAVGAYAGQSLTTGSSNVLVGNSSGVALTTGINNALIGAGAGYAMTTGSNNTILGAFTGNAYGFNITASNNYIVLADGEGNLRLAVNGAGVVFTPQGTHVTKSATSTLTGAEVLSQILQYTGTAGGFLVTMPTGTSLDAATGGMPINTAFDFTVINTTPSSCGLGLNTGITAIGSLVLGSSGVLGFRIRKTAPNTFIMYRN